MLYLVVHDLWFPRCRSRRGTKTCSSTSPNDGGIPHFGCGYVLPLETKIDIFKKHVLIDARKMIDIPGLLRSRKAVHFIGSTHSGDIVWLKDAKCGRVHLFYELSGSMIASLHLFNNVANDPSLLEERQSIELFIDPCQIVDACTWYYESPGIVRVAIPPMVLMA
jgi:hypothetical protein